MSYRRQVYVCKECGHITCSWAAKARMFNHVLPNHLGISMKDYSQMMEEYFETSKKVEALIVNFTAKFNRRVQGEKELSEKEREELRRWAKGESREPVTVWRRGRVVPQTPICDLRRVQ